MNILRLAVLAAIYFVFSLGSAVAQDLYYGGFDGRWEGTLNPINPAAYDPDRGSTLSLSEFAFSIKGSDVRVFYKREGKWIEHSVSYQLLAHKTNAVIAAINSSQDVEDKTGSGGWVETWNFTVTHKDRGGLYVVFTRSVNNYLLAYNYRNPQGKLTGRFFNIAYGEMIRTP